MAISLGLGFGKGSSKSSISGSTGFSSAHKGRISLDPSIRAIQDEVLGNLRDVRGFTTQNLNDFLSRSSGLRQRFEGNRGALMQARINPVLQANAQRLGGLQRGLGQRNLGGSSFSNRALGDEASRGSRELGDATSLAEMESLQALTGLDQNTINTVFQNAQIQAMLNGESADIARERAMIEIQALSGLGTQRGSQRQVGLNLGFKLDGSSGSVRGKDNGTR